MGNEIEIEIAARREALNQARAVVDALVGVNECFEVYEEDDLDEAVMAALNLVWSKAQAAVEFAAARLAQDEAQQRAA